MEDKRNEQHKQWWETHKGELEKKPASNAYSSTSWHKRLWTRKNLPSH
ncbi:MAG: hypothetical protein IIT96_00690 [Muribaculaceae bacterium]|nr:hypothetical protein [Muribaculaceae bacterium]